MDDLEKEINSIGEQVDMSEVAGDIIEGKSAEAITIFAASVILALANGSRERMERPDFDPAEISDNMFAVEKFAGIIINMVPVEFHQEALDALSHLDNAVNFTRPYDES